MGNVGMSMISNQICICFSETKCLWGGISLPIFFLYKSLIKPNISMCSG